MLNVLNGSYIMGYSDMNKNPFAPLVLVSDGYDTVKAYIESKPELYKIAKKTIGFLTGFYSNFALELLSSLDVIEIRHNTFETKKITEKLEKWSDRKRSLFSNTKYIDVSVRQLQQAEFV
ncbi:MAG: hypothetical protein PHW82_07600 [Bacteroidales bacterium]|nr:hypothetical protein [Bacteroidales bacterium]